MESSAQLARDLDRFVATTVGWREPLAGDRWPDDAELALVEALFTPRRAYGTPRGPDGAAAEAWACIEHWRALRGDDGCDDLATMASSLGRDDVWDGCLAVDDSRVLGSSPDRLHRWGAVREVAAALAGSGARTAAHLRHAAAVNAQAVGALVTGVRGVGEVTRDLLLLLVGARMAEADETLRAFVAEALGDVPRGTGDAGDVSAEDATHLLWVVAEQRGVDPAALQHAVWADQRRAQRDSRAA